MNEIKIGNLGYVRLLDSMGNDWTPVQAARISYDEGLKGEESDKKLERFLMAHGHTSPFEMVEIMWEIKAPIAVARQWVRHRTANWNEVSGRYSILKEEFFFPEALHTQDTKNRQGRGPAIDAAAFEHCADLLVQYYDYANWLYHHLLDMGVSRDEARYVLPLATYTKWFWKNDLHNTLHFLKLRTAPGASDEIREFAEAMVTLMTERFPNIMALWEELGRP